MHVAGTFPGITAAILGIPDCEKSILKRVNTDLATSQSRTRPTKTSTGRAPSTTVTTKRSNFKLHCTVLLNYGGLCGIRSVHLDGWLIGSNVPTKAFNLGPPRQETVRLSILSLEIASATKPRATNPRIARMFSRRVSRHFESNRIHRSKIVTVGPFHNEVPGDAIFSRSSVLITKNVL